jgi:hypothetical protein
MSTASPSGKCCVLSLHISARGRELHDGHRSFTFMPNASSLSSGACATFRLVNQEVLDCCYKPRSWVDLSWTCCIPQWVAANKTRQLNLWYKYVNILLQCGQDRPWALQGLVVHIVLVIWHFKCRTFILPQCRSGNFTLFVTMPAMTTSLVPDCGSYTGNILDNVDVIICCTKLSCSSLNNSWQVWAHPIVHMKIILCFEQESHWATYKALCHSFIFLFQVC